jgi:cell cycle arrest protein BUB3
MSNGSSSSDSNKSEFRLKDAPEDAISSVRFGPNSSQFLLASSWDTNVRLYDVVNNNLRVKYSHGRPGLFVSI